MTETEEKVQTGKVEKETESKASKHNRKRAQTKATEFPAATRINDYGFLHFKKRWLEELGWAKGTALKIDRSADGTIILRKA